MNAHRHRSASSQPPTPDDMAGIPVPVEGVEDVSVRPKPAGSLPPGCAGRPAGPPTPDDLAGIPVCVEGKEDLTVRRRPARPTALPAPGGTAVLDSAETAPSDRRETA